MGDLQDKNVKAEEYAEKIRDIIFQAEKEGVQLSAKVQYGQLAVFLDNAKIFGLSAF